jgi:hypothetical protein
LISYSAPRSRFTGFHLGFAVTVLLGNAVILGIAWQDRSWGALWIELLAGPIMNGILAVISLAVTPVLRRLFTPFATGWHILFSLLLPAAAIVLDGVAISNMGLHGC